MTDGLEQRARLNDALRGIIAVSIRVLGVSCSAIQRVRIAVFPLTQARLRRRYRIADGTPVLTYGEEIESSIRSAAVRIGAGARWAETSGSTGAPKRILYTKSRLRAVRWAFVDHFVRLFHARRLRRTSLYVFRPLDGRMDAGKDDRSLTSLLVEEKRSPSYIETLQAPYRIESDPAVQSLVQRYGSVAVRLWVLAIANPGVLYCTNPSTLWLFLHTLASDWDNARQLVVDVLAARETFSSSVHTAASRLASTGCDARLRCIASSSSPLPLAVCAPAVRVVVSWTGGYVKPFLDRIAAVLSVDRYRLVPMYSMSTETIETAARFSGERLSFLPIAAGVFYEFLEEGMPDRPEYLRAPHQLVKGTAYTMVVSDAFGLRRYQTEDVFLCKGVVHGMPDLHFLRRRGLEYSFTGEKVSAVQLNRVFARLRSDPEMNVPADAFLTCAPASSPAYAIPYYQIFLTCSSDDRAGTPWNPDAIARRCDALLQEENSEYRAKRASGRLEAPRLFHLPFATFVAAFSGAETASSADGQFKFLPLYCSVRVERVRH